MLHKQNSCKNLYNFSEYIEYMEDKKYTQKEILEMFSIHRQTLNNWRRNGTIKYEKINKRKFLYYLPETKIIQEDEERI